MAGRRRGPGLADGAEPALAQHRGARRGLVARTPGFQPEMLSTPRIHQGVTTMVVLTPVPAKERVEVIDVLRGFALFGVLLANALWYFSGFADLSAEDILQLPANVLDAAVFELELFFVSNKFISIFSLLFGMGFALQMRRAEERHAPLKRVYVRRML